MREDDERVVRIDVALAPSELASMRLELNAAVAIVVDVIRATTTLAVLFDRGCRRVLLAPDIEAARAAKRTRPDALLAGEVGGATPPGFDLGNSPSEISLRDLRGREVIFATTNGTRALRACAGSGATFAGSLRNADAVSRAALASIHQTTGEAPPALRARSRVTVPIGSAADGPLDDNAPDILVVCAGRSGRPAYDDTICAGQLCQAMVELASATGAAPRLGEGARVAIAASRDAEATGLLAALAQSDAARAVAAIGLSNDLEWCVALNASPSVPWIAGGDDAGLLDMQPWRRAVI